MVLPKPRGLIEPLQNLLILVFAEHGQYAFTLRGGAYEPNLKDLPDELVLIRQTLPPATAWQQAVKHAGELFGLTPPPLLTANNLAKFNQDLREEIKVHLDPCRRAQTEIERRQQAFGISQEDGNDRSANARLAAHDGARAERMAMAVRLVRWLATEGNLAGADARDTARRYAAAGGFVDWARSRIWQGDQNEVVDRAYRAVAEAALAPRQAANEYFAAQLEAVAEGLNEQPDARFIESLLDRIVAPLARHKPVLLLVLDGMSMAVYRELALAITDAGWIECREHGVNGERCLLAMLPTVTSVSRASLLAGERMAGDSAKEKKAFQAQKALRQAAGGGKAPVLYHQGELREAGGGGLASPVREQLADPQRRVVGLVLNAIDDHLSSSSPVVDAWSVERVALLAQVLEAARDGSRIVIITSDHGHVINHDMELRATTTTGAAGRFKAPGEPVAAGEIKISGPRVLSNGNTAILVS